MILKAVLGESSVVQRMKRVGVSIAFFLVALALTIISTDNRFGIFPEYVGVLKSSAGQFTNFAQANIASVPIDIKEQVSGSLARLIPTIIGVLILSAIFLLVKVTIRECLLRKKETDRVKRYKRMLDSYK